MTKALNKRQLHTFSPLYKNFHLTDNYTPDIKFRTPMQEKIPNVYCPQWKKASEVHKEKSGLQHTVQKEPSKSLQRGEPSSKLGSKAVLEASSLMDTTGATLSCSFCRVKCWILHHGDGMETEVKYSRTGWDGTVPLQGRAERKLCFCSDGCGCSWCLVGTGGDGTDLLQGRVEMESTYGGGGRLVWFPFPCVSQIHIAIILCY